MPYLASFQCPIVLNAPFSAGLFELASRVMIAERLAEAL
jgi:hypothetical protein